MALSVLAVVLVAVLLLGAYKAWNSFGKTHAAAAVTASVSDGKATATVTRGDLNARVIATGNLKPMTEVVVGSELSGIVQEVFVQSNDLVKKGDPLAKLDVTKLSQQVENSRAALASAQTQVSDRETTLREKARDFERNNDLFKRSGGKIPSRAEIDASTEALGRAKAALDDARASVQSAQAQLAIDENNLGKAVIKSPINGVVLSRGVEPGETVATDLQEKQIFVIAEDLKRMKLIVAVAEADIGKVSAGQDAEFTVDAYSGKRHRAKVSKVENAATVTNNVITYSVELEVPNDDLSLRSGMTATAEIHVAKTQNALLVPGGALNFTPAGATPPALASGEGCVWRAEGKHPVPVVVKIGARDAHFTEIISPNIREGMQVLVGAGD